MLRSATPDIGDSKGCVYPPRQWRLPLAVGNSLPSDGVPSLLHPGGVWRVDHHELEWPLGLGLGFATMMKVAQHGTSQFVQVW